MNISDFVLSKKNGCDCYTSGVFLIVERADGGGYNAYKNGSSIQKLVIRQDNGKNEMGEDVLSDVLGAKDYPTPQAAAADCIGE